MTNESNIDNTPVNPSAGTALPPSTVDTSTPPSVATTAAATAEVALAKAGGADSGAIAAGAVTNEVTLKSSGTVKGEVRVPLGTKVKDALRKIASNVVVTSICQRNR